MTRREAISYIAFASAGTILMTGCADKVVTEMLMDNRLLLDRRHTDYLAKISETFLPLEGVDDIAGSPTEFILTMLNDCRKDQEIADFATGFEQYKSLMKENSLKIRRPDPGQMIPLVKAHLEANPPQEELVHFISTVRDLSIRYLKSSEHYLKQYMEFEMIPEVYDPCRQI